jgi:hypothetical protein
MVGHTSGGFNAVVAVKLVGSVDRLHQCYADDMRAAHDALSSVALLYPFLCRANQSRTVQYKTGFMEFRVDLGSMCRRLELSCSPPKSSGRWRHRPGRYSEGELDFGWLLMLQVANTPTAPAAALPYPDYLVFYVLCYECHLSFLLEF